MALSLCEVISRTPDVPGARYYAFKLLPNGEWIYTGPGHPAPRRTDYNRKRRDRAHRRSVRQQRRHMAAVTR